MSFLKRIVVSFFLLSVYGCNGGGGGGNANNAPAPTSPAAPILTLTFDLKTFRFSWGAVADVTHYRLFERADVGSGYSQVGGNVDASLTSYSLAIAVHKKNWAGVRYLLEACNSVGCTPSASIDALSGMLATIGYVKPAASRTTGDWFGSAVALSADGTTLAIGVPEEDSALSGVEQFVGGISVGGSAAVNCGGPDPLVCANSGAVYVYVRASGGVWQQQAYIKATNTGPGDEFGAALALSSSGNTLAVAAPSEDGVADAFNDSGAVYVYARSGGSWSASAAPLRATEPGIDDRFGAAVALNSDGTNLIVGVPWDDAASAGVGANPVADCLGAMTNCASRSGAVYAFAHDGTDWSQPPIYIKASNPAQFDEFGGALALSGDGTTLAVGAVLQSNGAYQGGAVYLFNFDGSMWTQLEMLKASNAAQDDRFGSAVAISSDGNTLVVGADSEDSGSQNGGDNSALNAGAVYVYTRTAGVWGGNEEYLKASTVGAGDRFGAVVALSSDGSTLAVGAPNEASSATGIAGDQVDDSAGNSGAVYVYRRAGGAWMQQNYVKAPNTGANDNFGAALALNLDGDTLAVGARLEDNVYPGIGTGADASPNDDSSTDSGAVYLY